MFFSIFKTLVGKNVIVEMKNGVEVRYNACIMLLYYIYIYIYILVTM